MYCCTQAGKYEKENAQSGTVITATISKDKSPPLLLAT